MSRQHRTGSPRGLLVALVALVVAALAATLLGAGPATAGKKGDKRRGTADKTWSGFVTRPDGRASGGFLGARKVDGTVVYRIDPRARKTSTKGFEPPAYVDTLVGTGKKTVSTLDTQRAAWIVAKYGSYRDKTQSAAVELALDDLLVGGKYSLKGAITAKRLAQVPAAKAKRVRKLAQDVLTAAAAYASTYAVSLTSTPSVALGGVVTVSVRVTSTATGAGIANLPVTFGYPGAAAVGPVTTDPTGTAQTTFTATAAGPQLATASVDKIPESRLIVLTPTTRKASRVVVSAIKTATSTTAITAVRAKPTTAIRTSYGAIASPYKTSGQTFTLAGGYASPAARTATATLYGPYTSDALARCTGGTAKVVGKGSVSVRTNASTYKLPTLTLPSAGYYRWLLTVPADSYNDAPAALCGGVMRRVS